MLTITQCMDFNYKRFDYLYLFLKAIFIAVVHFSECHRYQLHTENICAITKQIHNSKYQNYMCKNILMVNFLVNTVYEDFNLYLLCLENDLAK